MADLFDVRGKRAIVTGGTRGLGYSMAEGVMEAGCTVAIVGSSDRVFDAAEAFRGRGFDCHGVKADLSRRQEVYAGFNACMEKLGGELDILVNSHGATFRCAAEDYPVEEWDRVMNVNINSVFILCQEAAKVMLPKGYGKIINIASMLSFYGGQNVPAYAASKGAIAQMTKEMNNDWMGRGIRVNAIAPGWMATDMNAALTDPSNPRFEQISIRIPAGRWGNGDDLKGACLFLASPASDYVGGVILPVDGGYLVK